MDPVRLGGVAPPSTDSRATLDANALRPSSFIATRDAKAADVMSSGRIATTATAAAALVPDTPETRTAATGIPMAHATGAASSQASQHTHQQQQSPSQQQLQHPSTAAVSHARNPTSLPQQEPDSQESTMTSSSSDVFTPTASDASNGGAPLSANDDSLPRDAKTGSQLHQLSALAAAQRKMVADGPVGALKRTADGQVKTRLRSTSPIKGHSRTTSAISVASTTGSKIGEVGCPVTRQDRTVITSTNTRLQLSAELKTRLSYAMVKVNNGWQSHSLDEVESLASRAASPSSTSTVHRRQSSSASPLLPLNGQSVHFANDVRSYRPKSDSPPSRLASKPTLAPPAPIQPSMSMAAPRSNPRRNSNPRYTPTLLSHSHSASASPHTPVQPHHINTGHSRSQPVDPILFSPHQNEREQDAIESLLFMSTPGNSANLKHTFSPTGSPGSQTSGLSKGGGRHALPSGPRKALPSQRQQPPQKKIGLDRSPGVAVVPGSPMDLDSPQQAYLSPHRAIQRRRTVGATSHLRGALSLPSGLGLGNGTVRKALRDEDIERMLDRASAEADDSSDDEEIQLPRSRAGTMTNAMEV
ncbi:hypothetical protein HJFPF1_02097 [Paramyrothecium foliicola]|nr:hypothetical protein HJFPF1_02097 [Paramyrothecium foliicola]